MPAQAGPRKAPDAQSTEEQADTYALLRRKLTECMQLLAVENAHNAPQTPLAPVPDLSIFTDRELEFLRWVQHRECWPYPYIAAQMGLKPPTFHYMRRKVFAKLDVNCRTALALLVRDWPLG